VERHYVRMLKREYMMLLMTCSPSLLDIIESICALGNIGLLIYFTNREWRHSRKKEELNAEQALLTAKLERQKLWYDKIVIERIVTYLLEYFDSTDKIIGVKKVQLDAEKRVLYDNIKQESRHCKRLIVPCLEIFSHGFTQEINRLLQEHSDIIIQEVDRPETRYSYDFERRVNDKKGELLKTVYEYDFKHNV